ncbi:hypothetical protein TRFO_43081 [Tritrichomonas foetus]|uniref:Uncharacterized protein n=1 Tax=Tritrichomonas foetus TaxID=1144522 RepID=A0A1J4KXF9_9EUKA|nr:hypothetical protein TRFO_43081 [Tritrichomonas foetus]|eukprot:OHT14388.1 hypothetical protein TRFO_43081 [Tritrichomonas foetus]
MFIFLFFGFSSSRISPDEFELYPIMDDIGISEVSTHDDPPRHSQYAYVSYYSYDDHQWSHYFLNILVLGCSLKSLSPQYDRVLMIPSGMKFDEKRLDQIKKVWSHIVFRSYVKWNCTKSENKTSEKQLWFKLQMFTLIQYDKIVYIGPNILIVRDPSILFSYGIVAAPADYQAWRYSKYGIIHNHELGLYFPNLEDYNSLTSQCKFVTNPTYLAKDFGPYDNGLLEFYFRFDMVTLPEYWQYEIFSTELATKFSPSNPHDQRIISYRYSVDSRPWETSSVIRNSLFSQIYVQAVIKTYEFLGESLDLQKYQFYMPKSEHSKYIINRMPKISDSSASTYKIYEFYHNYEGQSFGREISRYIAIILGSIGIVGYAIVEAPLSSRDTIDGELMED